MINCFGEILKKNTTHKLNFNCIYILIIYNFSIICDTSLKICQLNYIFVYNAMITKDQIR